MKTKKPMILLVLTFLTGCASANVIDKSGYCGVKTVLYASPDASGKKGFSGDSSEMMIATMMAADSDELQKSIDEGAKEIDELFQEELGKKFRVISGRDEVLSASLGPVNSTNRAEKLTKYCQQIQCDAYIITSFRIAGADLYVHVVMLDKNGRALAEVPPGSFNAAATMFGKLRASKKILGRALDKLGSVSCS